MEFEWKISPGFTTLQILAEIQNMMTETLCELEQFPGLILAGSEKEWYGIHIYRPNGEWNRVAEDMMLNFSESGHPVFHGSSALERGDLKSKGKGKLSIRFCSDDETPEVVLRTITSVNQLSIYGAVADMCDELVCRIFGCSERTGKLVAQDNPETTVIPTELTTTSKSPRTDDNGEGKLLQNYEQKIANLPEHLQLNTKTVARGTVFHDPRRCGTGQIGRLMTRENFTSRERSIQSERMDPWRH